MEPEQQKISGYELELGEVCPCGCLATEHDLNGGCQIHPQCLNFYRYHDFEFLSDLDQ